MAGEDLDLKIIIDTLLNAKGFDEAKAGLAGLTTATNTSAAATKVMAEGQNVSSREIKILTRELLSSIGMTQGSAAASRVASTAFLALGDSAAIANLALAGTGLAVVLLVPKIIEWITHTREQTAEQERLAKELRNGLPDLVKYAEDIHNMNSELQKLYELQQSEANAKQLKLLSDLSERNQKLAKDIDALTVDTTQWVGDARAGYAIIVHATEENRAKAAELRKEYDANQIALDAMSAAIEDGTNIETQAAAAHHKTAEELKAKTDAINKAKEAEKEYERELEKAFKQSDTQHFKEQQYVEDFKNGQANEGRAAFKAAADVEAAALKRTKAEGKAILAEARGALEERKLLLQRMSLADLKLRKAEATSAAEIRLIKQVIAAKQAERTQTEQTYVAAVTTMIGAFSKNKALNIAAAIADTYAAADRAFWMSGGYPWGVAPMVLTIAQGLANVANIQKVGFDDPFNDVLASKLGRKSAADFVEHFGRGFQAGMGGGGSVINQTTINRGTTMNVTANGVLGSRTAFRSWLEREMTLAERVRARKSI